MTDHNPLLYHFTSTRFALEDIRKRRLKVAQFDDLNDPFELEKVELKTKDQEFAFKIFKADVARRFGVLCFSRRWDRILQWSHYAERHRGICLGFDVSGLRLKLDEVRYERNKLPFPANLDLRFSKKMLHTKFYGWEYEEEWRVFLTLETPEWNASANRNLYFANFGTELALREVLLGAENDSTVGDIQNALGADLNAVQVWRIRLSPEKFRLERERL